MRNHFLRAIQKTVSAVTDPFFKQVALLLSGDGTNGAQNQTFVDSSTNNFSITRNGNATQGSFSPFSLPEGQWSNFFDGAGTTTTFDTLVTSTSSAALDLSSGSNTVECWVFPTARPSSTSLPFGENSIFALRAPSVSAGAKYYGMTITSSGFLAIRSDIGFGGIINVSTTSIPLNTWTHIAWVRSGGTNKFYVNGIDRTSTFSNPNINGFGTVTANYEAYVGITPYMFGSWTYLYPFQGHISNFRVVKGTALYTSTFTPATTPLNAITNTSLLTCQSNRFKDNSSSNFTINRVGDVRVTAFSPFAPTSAYSPSVNGGSGYFDGSGDFLNTSGAALNIMGTGTFTLECFVNITGAIGSSGYSMLISQDDGSSGNQGFQLGVSSSYAIRFLWWTGSSRGANSSLSTSNNVLQPNSWNHVAVSWDGTTLRIFVNGVVAASTTSFSPYNSGISTTGIGHYWTASFASNAQLFGYMSNVRIVKGTAVYTSNFTPPTAPLTAITNTSLLLNFTNAGIVDSAAKNVLETVGNAQVSTSVTRFGTGSMYFDGTGDYITIPNAPYLSLPHNGNWTIEFWTYPTTFNGYPGVMSTATNGTTNGWSIQYNQFGGSCLLLGKSGTIVTTLANTPDTTANTWTHIAFVCQNGNIKGYANGVAGPANSVLDPAFRTTNPLIIGDGSGVGGGVFNAAADFNGYIDDVRITIGVARYTANFTPPSAPYPDQ